MKNLFLTLFLLGTVVTAQDSLKALFIGNSYTAMNWSIPHLAKQLADSLDKTLMPTLSLMGGRGWANHWEDDNVARDNIKSGPWDYVVLQDQSRGAYNLPGFMKYGTLLTEAALNNGSDPMFYLTWSYEGNPPRYDTLSKVYLPSMQDTVTRAYLAIADSFEAFVSPVGIAHGIIRKERPDIHLWADGTHPNNIGAYLAAGIFAATLFGVSPMLLPHGSGNVCVPSIDTATENYVKNVMRRVMMDSALQKYYPEREAVTTVKLLTTSASLPTYGIQSLKLSTTYSNNHTDTFTTRAHYLSLDTNIAVVNFRGQVMALRPGTARIVGYRRGVGDTLSLTVLPNLATCDSIRLKVHALPLLAGQTYPITCTGYFTNQGRSYSLIIPPEAVVWTSSMESVAACIGNTLQGRTIGTTRLQASLSSRTDTCRIWVTANQPKFIKRINFQTVAAEPVSQGWVSDWGAAYAQAAGYGWVSAPGLATRNDRKGNAFLKSFVQTLPVGVYRVDVPAGDYIVRLAMGDNVYGSTDFTNWTSFGNDTLIRNSGPTNTIVTDTVSVSGTNGLQLSVHGNFNYLIVLSKEGIDMNHVAWDDGIVVPPVLTTPAEDLARLSPLLLTLDAYPNPFNRSTSLRWEGSETGRPGHVAIYNIAGRQIASLNVAEQSRTVTWNAQGLTSGVYFAVFSNGRTEMRKKLLLVR